MKRSFFLSAFAALLCFAQKPANRPVFILLGPPGAGKSTHSKILSDRYKIPVVEAAALLKKSHGGKGEIGKALKVQTAAGDLLGDRGMNDLFLSRVRMGDCYNGLILDGYPATKSQAEFMVAQLKELTFPSPVVLHLRIGDELSKKRMKERGRADDKAVDPDKRLAEYRAEEKAILDFFPPERVVSIDSSGSVAQVSEIFKQKLAERK